MQQMATAPATQSKYDAQTLGEWINNVKNLNLSDINAQDINNLETFLFGKAFDRDTSFANVAGRGKDYIVDLLQKSNLKPALVIQLLNALQPYWQSGM